MKEKLHGRMEDMAAFLKVPFKTLFQAMEKFGFLDDILKAQRYDKHCESQRERMQQYREKMRNKECTNI